MKARWKVLELFGNILDQIIIGWIITEFVLKINWSIRNFVTDPGMIAFWIAYAIIELLIVQVRRHEKNSEK